MVLLLDGKFAGTADCRTIFIAWILIQTLSISSTGMTGFYLSLIRPCILNSCHFDSQ